MFAFRGSIQVMPNTDVTPKRDRGRLPTVAVDAEVLDALDQLSRLTGLSKVWLIRSLLTQHLESVGLIAEADTHPTKRKS